MDNKYAECERSGIWGLPMMRRKRATTGCGYGRGMCPLPHVERKQFLRSFKMSCDSSVVIGQCLWCLLEQ